MTFHYIILVVFTSLTGVILLSGILVKQIRRKKHIETGAPVRKAKKIEISLQGDLLELGNLAIILDDLERYQIPVKTILEINIVIEEVFTGIIKRQKESQQETGVLITLILDHEHILIRIRDYNDEFNPIAIPKIDLNAPIEEISFHGLGFHIVRHLTDHLSYQRKDGQNILTIRKNYVIK